MGNPSDPYIIGSWILLTSFFAAIIWWFTVQIRGKHPSQFSHRPKSDPKSDPYLDEIIKKWELILRKDLDKNITYNRKVLEEMLTDFRQQVKSDPYLDESKQQTELLRQIHKECKRNSDLVQKYNSHYHVY